ncbi:MAG: penicillin-binding protein 1C [Acidobacteriota bacterium]
MRRRLAWLIGILGLLLAAGWIRLGALPTGLLDEEAPSTVVLDRNGVLLYEARSALGDRSWRMDANSIPKLLGEATLAAEDHRFWSHPGIDAIAIARALAKDVRACRVMEGGSTISQQVVKLLLARQAGTHHGWRAKAYEAIVALRLEHRLSKREILALYLSLAPYGNQIAGAERASRAYFNRGAAELTVAQAAFLASLPQRPSAFNPWRDVRLARARQLDIIDRMQALGWITAAEASVATAERLAPAVRANDYLAPHFVENVLATYPDRRRPARLETTLDAGLQRTVRGIIDAHRNDLRLHGASNVAVVVLENRSGEWLAWEGSGDYFDPAGGTIDGARALRQPGSALKPFTYALAFDRGYSPASVLPDVPSHFPTAESGVFYSPRNYDDKYRGPLLARAALAGSENVPAVALLAELGPSSLLRLLRRSGMTTFDKAASYYGLGLTLGNAEVRLDELVNAYSALARGGISLEPISVKGTRRQAEQRLVSARAAYWVTDILSDPDAREFVFGRGGSLEFPFPVAAKTGTSQAYHDNWAVGYTREVTVGVWVGNFDRTPLRSSSGVTGAGPIFHAVMLAAMTRVAPASAIGAGTRAFDIVPVAPDTERRPICLLSGMAASSWCPRQGLEWVATGSAASPCSWHHDLDGKVLTVWPAQYRAWAAGNGLLEELTQPVISTAARKVETTGARIRRVVAPGPAALSITNPPPGAIYLIDPTLRREFQTLPLRASGASGEVTWTVDGRAAGRADANAAVHWPLAVGSHHVSVKDDRGRHAETTVFVK